MKIVLPPSSGWKSKTFKRGIYMNQGFYAGLSPIYAVILLFASLTYFYALKMKATYSFQTSVNVSQLCVIARG
jgi:hypothetical protein